jgi:hypothetical protein
MLGRKMALCAVASCFLAASAARAERIAHWPFEESVGTNVYDRSTYHNDGVYWNGTLQHQAGKVGFCLGFDGVDDYVSAPDSPSLDLVTNAMTLSAWINPRSLAVPTYNQIRIISRDQRWVLALDRGGGSVNLAFNTGLASGSTGSSWLYLPNATNYVRTNVWTHVAGVYDGAQMCIYVNGVSVTNAPRTGAFASYYANVVIGRNATNCFCGRIDEPFVDNAVVDIAEYYWQCLKPPLTGLLLSIR